ncbi:hydroxypyruvate isomerase family protein [Aestuariispira insulae]|uniref:Hydroxypyruvate isomerase n=1 Tax=Aestuariispira insulae TaxID=1461337 RepID=A0A3D9HND4_9PROT|nr:TIM barrel protein [Aestuariispira insulae]RED50925.1 hydroxypyruvate isomerase [Aestuariispira insulae]
MKLSANLSFLFPELSFQDRFQAAAACGFHGVEFLFPYGNPAEEIKNWLKEAKLESVLFNAPPGDWKNGERGIAALPGREEEFQQSFQLALSYAANLNCPRIHVMAGNIPVGYGAHDCYAVLARNLQWAALLAAKNNITLLLEPLNPGDMPGYLYSRTSEVANLIDRLGQPNVKLQLDLYHREIVEGDTVGAIEQFRNYIGHIQIAGVPDRNEPNLGTLDLKAIFKAIHDVGYRDWIGCEYNPMGATQDGLTWAEQYLDR